MSKYFVFNGTTGQHHEFKTLKEAEIGQNKFIQEIIISIFGTMCIQFDTMRIKEECTFADGTTQLKILDEKLPEYTLEYVGSIVSSTISNIT